jgi:3-oxoacyl-[acyl-carrier protein] reductase
VGDGRTALVTGASGGLGAAVAIELARAGYAVAVHYASNVDAAKHVADALDGESMVVGADVADWGQVQGLVEAVEEELGPVEVLVNSAGIRRDGLMAGQSVDEWRAVIDVNLLGTFHTCRAVLPRMLRARRGRIVNVVSPAGLRGSEGQTAYSASKAGVVGLTRSLARECARRCVTVNALAPGYLETPMTSSLPGERKQQILDATPIHRIATVEEIAAAVPFIVGADYMTGQVVCIDGGLST